MEENMIRGAILAMRVDNSTKTKLFDYLNSLEEFKREHKIMKRILVEHNLWEKLLKFPSFAMVRSIVFALLCEKIGC